MKPSKPTNPYGYKQYQYHNFEDDLENGCIFERIISQVFLDAFGQRMAFRASDKDMRLPANFPDYDIFAVVQMMKKRFFECKWEDRWDENITIEMFKSNLVPSGYAISKADFGIHTMEWGKHIVLFYLPDMLSLISLYNQGDRRVQHVFKKQTSQFFRNSNPPAGGQLGIVAQLLALKHPCPIMPQWIVSTDLNKLAFEPMLLNAPLNKLAATTNIPTPWIRVPTPEEIQRMSKKIYIPKTA